MRKFISVSITFPPAVPFLGFIFAQSKMAQQRLRNWCWTSFRCDPDTVGHFNVPDRNDDHRCTVFQYEYCEITGRLHAQGYTEWLRPKSLNQMKELFEDPALHCEKRKSSTREKAIAYCCKRDTRVPGTEPFFIGAVEAKPGSRTDLEDARKRILAHTSLRAVFQDSDLTAVCCRYSNWVRTVYAYKDKALPKPDIKLRAWQHLLISIIKGSPKKRQVIWVWSSESGTGKTTTYDYVSCMKEHSVLSCSGEFKDILYSYDGHTVLWFDLTRFQGDAGHIPYYALEKLSNQSSHLSSKYQSVMKVVIAHVVVTANVPPDENQLPGRFTIIKATGDTVLDRLISQPVDISNNNTRFITPIEIPGPEVLDRDYIDAEVAQTEQLGGMDLDSDTEYDTM